MALLLLLPRSVFGGSLAMASLPLVAAVGTMSIGALLRHRRLRIPAGLWLLLAVVVSGFLGASLTGELSELTTVGLIAVLAVWLFAGNLTRGESVVAAKVVLAAGVLVAAICVVEAMTGDPVFAASPNPHPNPLWEGLRAQATLPHPLVCAFVLAVLVAIAIRLAIPVGVKLVSIVLLIAGIVATGSSSALAIAVLAVVYWALTTGSFGARAAWATALAAVAGAALVFTPAADAIGEDLSLETNSHRLNSLLAMPALVLERPLPEVLLGSGWDSTQSLYERGVLINDGFFAIDNMFVAMLAVGGLAGFVLFAAFVLFVLARGSGPVKLGFVVSVVMGLSFDVLLWPITAAILAFCGAAAVSDVGERDTAQRGERTIQGIGSTPIEYRIYGVRTPV